MTPYLLLGERNDIEKNDRAHGRADGEHGIEGGGAIEGYVNRCHFVRGVR
jgi:hypothetical protein